jgi:hypothetical protein
MNFTWVNGKTTDNGVMVYISGRMEISMKVSGKKVLRMVKVLIHLQIWIHTMDYTRMVNLTVMVVINGHLELVMLEIFKQVKNMVKENG